MIKIDIIKITKELKVNKFIFHKGDLVLMTRCESVTFGYDDVKLYNRSKRAWLEGVLNYHASFKPHGVWFDNYINIERSFLLHDKRQLNALVENEDLLNNYIKYNV